MEPLDQLLALITHEIRNPLAAISFSLDSLKATESLSNDGLRLLELTARQAEQISNLLENLQDVSLSGKTPIQLNNESFDLNLAVEQAVHGVQPQILKKSQSLHQQLHEPALEIVGDSSRLIQAMTNIVENASKYTPEGGEIWVETGSSVEQVYFLVRDTGIGMDESARKKIFDPFFQVSNPTSESKGGVGLGLYLVQQIVQAHHGSVTVTSAGDGQGSAFGIKLPAATSNVT